MKVIVPDTWAELTPWQQREIIHIIQNTDTEDFTEQYIEIVQILLMKEAYITEYLQMRKILRQIPISAFKEALQFLWEKPTLYEFPKIDGLVEPAPRMGDLTIKQFSICDTLMHRYTEKKQEVFLRQLVACLYRLEVKENGEIKPHKVGFDEQKLREIAKITDKIDIKEAQRIGFIYSSIRRYITDSYPTIFPKKKDENQEENPVPIFQKPPKYTPFSQIITLMAADELRLLGNLHECQNTRLYDFMNAFLESKRVHDIRAKAMKMW